MAEEKFISKHTSTEIEAMLDKIKRDMQVIQFTQSEINTLLNKIENLSVPSKTSDLNNDSNFITNTVNNLINYYTKTETYTQSEINTLVSAATSGGFIKVNELPTENINIKAIYLVPYTGSKAKNLYEEYIYIDGDWEMIGTTKIDLSNYVTITALNTALADYLTSASFNTQIANYYNKTEITGLLSSKVDSNKIGVSNGVASLDNNGKVPSSQLPEQQNSGTSDYTDLTNKPKINNVELSGNKTLSDIGVTEMTEADINEIITPLPSNTVKRIKYSTSEQVVGTWIDGKPLYQKTINFGELPNTVTTKVVAHNISNLEKILFIYGGAYAYDSGHRYTWALPGMYNSVGNLRIHVTADATNISVGTSVEGLGMYQETYITLQYTKTTD